MTSAQDPFEAFKAFLEEHTSLPYVIILIVTFVIGSAVAHGTVALGKKWSKQGRWGLVCLLIGLVGLVSWIWWHRAFGAVLMLTALTGILWKPAGDAREWYEKREDKRLQRRERKERRKAAKKSAKGAKTRKKGARS